MYTFLGVIILFIILFYCKLRFCHAGRLMAKIPGVRGYPIVENLFTFILPPDKLFLKMREISKTYTTISKAQAFGTRYVNVQNPKDVEIILSSTKYNDKELPYTFLRPWLAEGLLVSNGEKWRQRRKLLTPAFHFNVLRQFQPTFTEQADIFLEKIEQESHKEKTDMVPLVEKATLSVMCETSMGTSLNQDPEKYFASIKSLSQCFVYRFTRLWSYVEWLYQISPKAFEQRKAIQEVHKFTSKVINDRRQKKQRSGLEKQDYNVDSQNNVIGIKDRLAMLDLLLENEAQGMIDGLGIREEVDVFVFEGHDTTAAAICFTIMNIANEPRVQNLVHEEMLRIFGNSQRKPSQDDLAEMKYLEYCVKETLRLYPSVPGISRFLKEDVVLSGYTVPAGTMLLIHLFDLHRRAEIYPDPEKFIPERFTPENSVNRHPYAYIPFSAGPRNCIGQKFAMMEIKTVLSGVLRRYRLEPVTKPEDLVFTVDLTLKTNHPIYVQFVKRQDGESPKTFQEI